MVIVGAKGHAIEIIQIFQDICLEENIWFFDNINTDVPDKLFDLFTVLKTFDEVENVFKSDNKFVLGLGIPRHRRELSRIFKDMGGELCSVISPYAKIGDFNVKLGNGLNIMTDVIISNEVYIGEGTLLNSACSVHHNVKIGDFCEISPGARILGNVSIGNNCSIGSNACILPKLTLGNNVVVGAGAVVTKNIPDNNMAIGIPAKFQPLKEN